MYRSTTLLILLAFILGLWVGFNPEARARAQAAWEQADVSLTEVGARLTASLDHLFNRVSEESPPPSNPPVEPKPSNFLGQLESALQQLWNGLVRLWNDLVNRASQPG
jgi:hypothetical protein